jgi:hypothetical protein
LRRRRGWWRSATDSDALDAFLESAGKGVERPKVMRIRNALQRAGIS